MSGEGTEHQHNTRNTDWNQHLLVICDANIEHPALKTRRKRSLLIADSLPITQSLQRQDSTVVRGPWPLAHVLPRETPIALRCIFARCHKTQTSSSPTRGPPTSRKLPAHGDALCCGSCPCNPRTATGDWPRTPLGLPVGTGPGRRGSRQRKQSVHPKRPSLQHRQPSPAGKKNGRRRR